MVRNKPSQVMKSVLFIYRTHLYIYITMIGSTLPRCAWDLLMSTASYAFLFTKIHTNRSVVHYHIIRILIPLIV